MRGQQRERGDLSSFLRRAQGHSTHERAGRLWNKACLCSQKKRSVACMSVRSGRCFERLSLTQSPTPNARILISLIKGKIMVQTELGAARNEWISYMRECSSIYKARKEAERVATEGPVDPPAVTDKVKRSKVGEPKRARARGVCST